MDALMTQEELEAKVEAMTDMEQAHFKTLITKLVLCYGDSPLQALVILGSVEKQIAGVMTLNCDEMEAAQLLQAAGGFFEKVNTMDAPPRELFN